MKKCKDCVYADVIPEDKKEKMISKKIVDLIYCSKCCVVVPKSDETCACFIPKGEK